MLLRRWPSTDDIGIDPIPQGDTGDGDTRLLAFLDDLGFEGFGVGVSLAHGNPDVKGNCVRLKIVDAFALIALDLPIG
jgi:hypothetical protein